MTTQNATSDPSEEFSSRVKDFLINNQQEELLNYFKVHGTDEILDKTSWSLVPVICAQLTQANITSKNDFSIICQELLQIFADKCNPAETVLLFLEQIEDSSDDSRFLTLLKPLETSLTHGDLSKSIEWVTSTIRAYTEALPTPENLKPEDLTQKNRPDPVIERLIVLHQSILNFLSPLIDISLQRRQSDPQGMRIVMNLVNIHLNLFSKPFSHFFDKKSIFNSTISQLIKLEHNLFRFLKIIEDRSHKRVNQLNPEADNNEYNLEVQLYDLEVSDLTYANFYFHLFSSDSLLAELPGVYHPKWVMKGCLYLGNCLLKEPEYVLVSKGLGLIDLGLKRVDEESITPDFLEWRICMDLFESLSRVMIYCDSFELRQKGLRVFNRYFERFSMRGRFRVIYQLYEGSEHPGLLGFIINMLKSWIIKSLEGDGGGEEFKGKLEGILKRIFRLENGSGADLVEMSDEIISSLNLLRFLVIRDREGETGVWRLVGGIQGGYLKELRAGVDLGKAHWRMKIGDIEEEKIKGLKGVDEVSVTVGGQQLPCMSTEEKIKVCHQAIQALDVIESLCVRVNECIDANPMRKAR